MRHKTTQLVSSRKQLDFEKASLVFFLPAEQLSFEFTKTKEEFICVSMSLLVLRLSLTNARVADPLLFFFS